MHQISKALQQTLCQEPIFFIADENRTISIITCFFLYFCESTENRTFFCEINILIRSSRDAGVQCILGRSE